MERLPARGPGDRSLLSQAWAAAAQVVTPQGPDELQNGRTGGGAAGAPWAWDTLLGPLGRLSV